LDGFSAFFLLHYSNKIEKSALIYPDVPSARRIPTGIDGKNILIVDVAYSYNIIRDIILRAKTVTFMDHHITIHEDMLKLAREFKNLTLIYDETKSGATLMWKYLFKSKSPPKFIRFIEDNDIGKWKMENCKQFITALRVKYSTTLTYDNLRKWKKLYDDTKIKELINLGKTYDDYKNFLAEDNGRKFTMVRFPSDKFYDKYSQAFTKPGQYKIAVYCGSPCPTSQDILDYIKQNYSCDFVIFWVLNLEKREYVLSFRSWNIDVGSIASILNGGGHKLAASGTIKLKDFSIDEIFYGNPLPRN